ncbi:MAG: Gx transporter family protein [Candidatus Cloacimonadales bacterium]
MNRIKQNQMVRLAFFTAFAVSVYVLESFIPKPLPFLRLGLSNIVILLLLSSQEYKSAFIVALSKTVIGGFFSGALISPTTLLSLSGTTISLLAMILALKIQLRFSLIGLSILGAVLHNITQIVVVRLLLIRHDTIFYLTPLLILTGIATGIITGYLAYLLSDSLRLTENENLINESNKGLA